MHDGIRYKKGDPVDFVGEHAMTKVYNLPGKLEALRGRHLFVPRARLVLAVCIGNCNMYSALMSGYPC